MICVYSKSALIIINLGFYIKSGPKHHWICWITLKPIPLWAKKKKKIEGNYFRLLVIFGQ